MGEMRFARKIFFHTEDTVVHLDPMRESDLAEGCQNVGKPSKKIGSRGRCIAG